MLRVNTSHDIKLKYKDILLFERGTISVKVPSLHNKGYCSFEYGNIIRKR